MCWLLCRIWLRAIAISCEECCLGFHRAGSNVAFDNQQGDNSMIHRKTLVAAALTLSSLASVASAAPFAYVPNEGGASISVIDTASDKVVDTIKDLGQKPRGLAASGDALYVSQQTNNQLKIVDLKQRKVVGSV